jgi:hypothetical protein
LIYEHIKKYIIYYNTKLKMGKNTRSGGSNTGSHLTAKQQDKLLKKQDAAQQKADQPTGQKKTNDWDYGGRKKPPKKKKK